jgi:hypothetical protein
MNDHHGDALLEPADKFSFSNGLKVPAHFFSYILHPIFLPAVVTAYFTLLHPLLFVGFSKEERIKTILIVLLNTCFFPLVTVLLLKALGFVSSIKLVTQKDRIIPYIASGIFYFWAYTVFKEQTDYPKVLSVFLLGIFLSSSAALLANIYYKVSMHMIGMGGVTGILLVLFYQNNLLPGWPLSAAFLLSGIVGTSRLILKSHQPFDIYSGYIIGLAMQLIAHYFVG